MIRVTADISIDPDEIQFDFIRASGPGGQNVNKVATAVQLRFDVVHSPSISEEVRYRLFRLAGGRITREGILIIDARRFRSQEQNRRDAVERLVEIIRKAAEKPRNRKRTRPTGVSRKRRLEEKRRRGGTKRMRRPVSAVED
ncbi:MAG: aminoacyl-tRNA hydrolase [Deltaproteobacteria bacterium]|nr:aminoacyl-tRNA hydrolase [Deltaproteobacteria bacterium]MBW2122826.1 aminoacyl-tRNA hydrolase [Deltaproteobacteria bacterium]